MIVSWPSLVLEQLVSALWVLVKFEFNSKVRSSVRLIISWTGSIRFIVKCDGLVQARFKSLRFGSSLRCGSNDRESVR